MRTTGWSGLALLGALLLLQACLARPAAAEDAVEGVPAPPPPVAEVSTPDGPPRAAETDDASPPAGFVSSQNIGDKLQEARQPRESLFDFGVRDAALRFEDRLYRKTKIRFASFYTIMHQHASGGSGPRDAGGGDLDVVATWDALGSRDKTTGAIEVAFETRHKTWTDIPPSGLSASIDSLWSTTSGFNIQDIAPVQIYWRQSLLRGRLRYQVGKLSPYSTFFGNRINSSSLFFVNYAFSDNPAIFMPGNGLGLHVDYDASPKWTFHAGIQDANGVKTRIDTDVFRNGEFWYAAQVDYHAQIRGLGAGTYRLGAWYVDARKDAGTDAGAGSMLSVDQELGTHVIAFLRYEIQGEGLLNPEVKGSLLTGTQSALRAGFGLPGPLRRLPDDYMGLGMAWGDPADLNIKNTWVGEIFYRSQIESSSQLTLSLQAIRSSTIYSQILVLTIRLRVEF